MRIVYALFLHFAGFFFSSVFVITEANQSDLSEAKYALNKLYDNWCVRNFSDLKAMTQLNTLNCFVYFYSYILETLCVIDL